MHPVFITGATGYIGRPLTAELIRRGHPVHALVRPGSEARLPPGATAVVGSALDESTFAHAVPRAADVVHLVGTPHPSPGKAAEFRRVDAASIRATVSAARSAGARDIIHAYSRPDPGNRDAAGLRFEDRRSPGDSRRRRSLTGFWLRHRSKNALFFSAVHKTARYYAVTPRASYRGE